MTKTALISQPAGWGDTIFAQGIAKHLVEQGYEVIWPVKNHMVVGLQRAYPKVNWIPDSLVNKELLDIKEDCLVNGVRIIPIRWSERILGEPVKYWMKTKFDLMGLDWRNWKEGAKFKRCGVRECKLFHEKYELERGEKYNLINTSFRNDSSKKVNINPNNGLKDVIMVFHEGYSLFDHANLIEDAENIYAANSSIFYLLELLELSAKEVHLYERTGDEIGFPHVDYIMTKNYILH
jgi:hypothetical protein